MPLYVQLLLDSSSVHVLPNKVFLVGLVVCWHFFYFCLNMVVICCSILEIQYNLDFRNHIFPLASHRHKLDCSFMVS